MAKGGLVWDGRPLSIPSFAEGGFVQSIAPSPLVQSSMSESAASKASAVIPGPSTMNVRLDPNETNMTMQSFVERELTNQFSRRSVYV
jgi:hypothetical protein